jgi:AcrR family transcriptional regulator
MIAVAQALASLKHPLENMRTVRYGTKEVTVRQGVFKRRQIAANEAMAVRKTKLAARREEMLDAAWHVFIEKGYARATMQDVAAQAHASKETLYAWFESKAALFETLLKTRLQIVGATLSAEAGPGFEPEKVLYIIARDLLRFVSAPGNMQLYRAAVADAASFPELKELLRESIDRTEFAGYLERCRLRGLMEFEDASEMASLFISMAQSEWPARISYGVIEKLSEKQIDHHARLAMRLFLKAVAPAKKTGERSEIW